MQPRERIGNLLNRKPVDRASFQDSLWGETVKRWQSEGHLKEGEDAGEHFQMELMGAGWLNSEANLETGSVTVEEDAETKLVKNGNGAYLRWWKN